MASDWITNSSVSPSLVEATCQQFVGARDVTKIGWPRPTWGLTYTHADISTRAQIQAASHGSAYEREGPPPIAETSITYTECLLRVLEFPHHYIHSTHPALVAHVQALLCQNSHQTRVWRGAGLTAKSFLRSERERQARVSSTTISHVLSYRSRARLKSKKSIQSTVYSVCDAMNWKHFIKDAAVVGRWRCAVSSVISTSACYSFILHGLHWNISSTYFVQPTNRMFSWTHRKNIEQTHLRSFVMMWKISKQYCPPFILALMNY